MSLAALTSLLVSQVVEDGYEFFAGRELVTLFSAPNYCGEFDNAGAIMSVDESLVCSFKVRRCYARHHPLVLQPLTRAIFVHMQILRPQ